MKLKLTAAAVSALLAGSALAGTASAKMFTGTVVHSNKRAHSFVIAGRHGQMTEVHARRIPATGRFVRVRAVRLRNGTFGARHIQLRGRHRWVHVRGVVTFVNRGRHEFVVSFRGGSIVVHRRVRRTRHNVLSARAMFAHSTTTLPSTGTVVTVDGSVDNQGTIQAAGVTDDSQTTSNIELEGRVLAIDTTAGTVTITADDSGDISGASITVTMPAPTFNVANYQVGQMLQIVATLNPDGTYTAVGASQDGNQGQANSQTDQQGHDGSGDTNSGDSSSGSSNSGTSTGQQSGSGTDN